MNEYSIVFSMFRITSENKITIRGHLSNCSATITGDTYEEALDSFKERKRNEGWHVVTLKEILEG